MIRGKFKKKSFLELVLKVKRQDIKILLWRMLNKLVICYLI